MKVRVEAAERSRRLRYKLPCVEIAAMRRFEWHEIVQVPAGLAMCLWRFRCILEHCHILTRKYPHTSPSCKAARENDV